MTHVTYAKLMKSLTRLTIISVITSLLFTSSYAGPIASTLPGQAPGAPVGSFPLSNFDQINLFNGHLNFQLPLVPMAGRGSAGLTVSLPIDQRWILNGSPEMPFPSYLMQTIPHPGFLKSRLVAEECQWWSNFYTQTQTLLVFTMQDGTEIELVDGIHSGQPALSECNPYSPGSGPASRGRFFGARDGSLTFVSDTNIYDDIFAYASVIERNPSGYLIQKDGTRYRITEGRVEWMRDRNGNLLTFTYEYPYGGRLSAVKDSLNRQVTIAYSGTDYGVPNMTITYKGFGGLDRTVTVETSNLADALIANESITTYQGLFGVSTTDQFNPRVIKLVRLPDNRTYQLRYNKYGELSRVELPTGGIFIYEWASGNPNNTAGLEGKFIHRRVVKKSIYRDVNTLVGSTSFGLFQANAANNAGTVRVRQLDANDQAIGDEKHYFHGVPMDQTNYGFGYSPPPIIGREYQVDRNTADGALLLAKVTHTFDPFGTNIIETQTTLADVSPNLISKQTFTYGLFNNLTDTYEYDFGQGAPGAFLRRSHTDFVTDAAYTGTDLLAVHAGTAAHLRTLPQQQWVSSDVGGSNKTSLTVFEYDNYSTDSLHAQLTARPNISGLCTTFSATGVCSNNTPTTYTTRGNATTVTSYTNASAQTGPITVASQYDVAGNVVKVIDARGNSTQLGYDDCYGSPDANAQNCAGATELGSQVSFAYATSVTNALNQISRSQFDYYLGSPVDTEDVNGVVNSAYYDDPLDRTKRIIRGANQAAGARSQMTMIYDDANRTITTKHDLYAFDDNAFITDLVYDGLGRPIESRQYEGGTNYIVIKTEYDSQSRPFKVSNPFRPQSESAIWNTTSFDALGRVSSVTSSSDNAQVSFAYHGDRILIADQNTVSQDRRKRITRNNALGLLIDVWEVTTTDGATESVSFPGYSDVTAGYRTSYEYDTAGNLKKVIQGAQPQRIFAYDSVNRLTSATNPESGFVSYGYDVNGNLQVKTDARNVSIHYDYDALNRLKRRWYNGSSSTTAVTHNSPALPSSVEPTDEVNFYYDNQSLPDQAPTFNRGSSTGRLVAQTYGGGNTGDYFGYDPLGREVLKIQRTGTTNYQTLRSYNLGDAVTLQTYPSLRVVTYNYDSAGRLADKDASNLAFTGNLGDGVTRTYARGITYAPGGQLKQEQFGTATAVFNKRFYNSRQQLAEILVSTSGGDATWNRGKIVNEYSLQCPQPGAACDAADNNGNLRKQSVYIPANDQVSSFTSWNQQYDYDKLNRLKLVHEYTGNTSLDWQQAYDYDRWGNRTINQVSTTGTNIPEPNFGVNTAKNQLTAPAGSSMIYDDAGNLTTDSFTGQGARAYDAENRMTKAWGGLDQWQFYTYDGSGQRIRRKVNNQETWHVYGFNGELLAEYPANGAANNPQKEYGYRNGELLITATAAGTGGGTTNSLSLNGTSNYAEVPSSTSLNIVGPITVEAWVKVNSIGVYQDIVTRESWAQAGTGGGYELCVTNLGKPRFDVYYGPTQYTGLIGNTTMSTGVWYHIAGVFDGSQLRVYLNEVLDGTLNTTNGPTSGTSSLKIGRTSGGSYFGGLIDEARVSNSAIYTSNFTPATNLTASGSTKGLWKFDGGTLNDFSTNGNNGTLVSGTYSTDVPGGGGGPQNSISLNGTSNYADVPNSSTINISGAITVEAWIKVNSITGAYQDVLARETWSVPGTGGGYELSVTNDGKPRVDFYQGPSQYVGLIGTTVMTTGAWHHIAGVFDGSQMRIYLDGVQTGSLNTSNGPASGTSPLRIGRTSGGSYFGGLIDEVRVSNAVLYTGNFTPATSLTATGSTKGLWKFDGQTLNDSSGNGNNGTLASGSYSTDVPGGGGGSGPTENVVWTGAVNVSVNGNSISKNVATTAWDAGANSTKSIVSGDGYVEMTISETNKDRFFGLSDNETTVSDADIDFSVRPHSNGVVYCYEPGTNGAFCSYYSVGQKLRVAVQGGVVKYYIIDGSTTTLMYTATHAPTYPLAADAAFYENGGTITNAVISGTLSGSTGGGPSGGVQWLVSDQLGTPRMVLDQSGSLANVKRHDYLPFGEGLEAGQGLRTAALGYAVGDAVRQKFTGKERDNETTLDYSMNRYYSSAQGRFTSVDPDHVGAYSGNPQTWNGYSYALNNPTLYTDPDGLKVRICGTDGQCTDKDTDLTDDEFEKWFRRNKSLKLKDGKVYKNGELIGTFERISCDECLYDIHGLARRVDKADPGARAVKLWAASAAMGLTLPSAGAGYIAIGVFVVLVPPPADDDAPELILSIESQRRAAVREAWKQEAERARNGQPTKTPFTPQELQELRDTGKVSGYEGHHKESVAGNPEKAGDPKNIKFVKGRDAHLKEHGGNWRNRTPLPRRR